jgi:putative spermidine/putrescine transport system ATP-binding protein
LPALLSLDSVTRRYGDVAALEAVSLEVDRGDFVTLLGPSGSGKSTALMAIAGFVTPDSGRVVFDGSDITGLPPERRGFGVVFQGYALFPHMTVAENIAYPLEVRGLDKPARAEKVRRALDLVQLAGLADRRPAQLSGGQQQRVAIARALVYEPPLLLLDEPMSALDRKLRGELQSELKALHLRLGTTFVNVTHDQDEALTLSTRVVVLSRGRVMQQGSPAEIYDRPDSDFVADFIGNANLIRLADVTVAAEFCRAKAGGGEIAFVPRHPLSQGPAILAVRQEALGLGRGGDETNTLSGKVLDAARVGASLRVTIEVGGVGVLRLTQPHGGSPPPGPGEPVTVSWRIVDGVHVRPQPD